MLMPVHEETCPFKVTLCFPSFKLSFWVMPQVASAMKSANERMTFHQERRKRPRKKALLKRKQKCLLKTKQDHYSLSSINK